MELKNIQIHYLDLDSDDDDLDGRAKELAGMGLGEILELKISKFDRYNSGKSIREFVDEKEVGPQLTGYVRSGEKR